MSIRDRFREVAHRLREIPSRLGLREQRVWLAISTFSGDHFGDGTEVANEVELTNGSGSPPKVVSVSERIVAAGIMPRGSVIVGPLTPEHLSGAGATQGTARSLLEASPDDVIAGQGLHLRIARGEEPGTRYRIARVETDRALRITIAAEPVGD